MKTLFSVITISLLSYFLFSCTKDTADPGTQPPGPYDFSTLDKLLDDSVPVRFGGKCYAIICVDGKPVYTRSYGGFTGETRQLIASCSKWLSAGVLMSLVDKGKIKLTDSVGKFLPIFTTYGKGGITIAQLFSHTSGFPGRSSQGYERIQWLTLAQAADSIAKNVPLINIPGKEFYYGGVSMQVAGRICEVASGKSWNDLFTENMAIPCGMMNTDYGLGLNPIIAGGARSTPDDYIKYLNMIMRRGLNSSGKRVLSEASIDAMEKSYIGEATVFQSPYPVSLLNTTQFYGIGNWRDLVGSNDVLIEDSSPGAFGSHPWVNRGKKITGFIFAFVGHGKGEVSPTVYTCLKIRSLCREIVD